jgi:hypothetical protein
MGRLGRQTVTEGVVWSSETTMVTSFAEKAIFLPTLLMPKAQN